MSRMITTRRSAIIGGVFHKTLHEGSVTIANYSGSEVSINLGLVDFSAFFELCLVILSPFTEFIIGDDRVQYAVGIGDPLGGKRRDDILRQEMLSHYLRRIIDEFALKLTIAFQFFVEGVGLRNEVHIFKDQWYWRLLGIAFGHMRLGFYFSWGSSDHGPERFPERMIKCIYSNNR